MNIQEAIHAMKNLGVSLNDYDSDALEVLYQFAESQLAALQAGKLVAAEVTGHDVTGAVIIRAKRPLSIGDKLYTTPQPISAIPPGYAVVPEAVKLLLLKAHRQLETEYRQQTRATEAQRVANATCGEVPGGASSIALLAESGYIHSLGKRNQEVRDEIFAMLAPTPSDAGKEG